MTDQLAVVLLVVCFIAGIRSTWHLRSIHKDETPPRNLITGAFYSVALVVTVAAGYFGFLSARKVLGFETLPGASVASIGIASVVLLIPVFLDYTVHRIRGNASEHAKLEAQGDRLEAALADNTRISREASNHADAAFAEANQVNVKLAGQADALIQQGADRADREAGR